MELHFYIWFFLYSISYFIQHSGYIRYPAAVLGIASQFLALPQVQLIAHDAENLPHGQRSQCHARCCKSKADARMWHTEPTRSTSTSVPKAKVLHFLTRCAVNHLVRVAFVSKTENPVPISEGGFRVNSVAEDALRKQTIAVALVSHKRAHQNTIKQRQRSRRKVAVRRRDARSTNTLCVP